MFEGIKQILNNAYKLSETDAWFFVITTREVEEEIIRMNTEDQLEEDGIDSENNSLGEYSLRTIIEKIQKGDRHDHVTLKDTGAFYNSFLVAVDRSGFSIVADDVAFYDRPLTEVYGIEILGLTKENTAWLGDFITFQYGKYVRERLLS